jgi:hypothetical protein
VLEELDEARQQYVSGEFENGDSQPTLPFTFSRIASAQSVDRHRLQVLPGRCFSARCNDGELV